MDRPPQSDSRNWPQWQKPPWILTAYLVFALLATALEFSVFYAPEFHRLIVPIIGWSGLGVYAFTLFFIIMAMITPHMSARIEIFFFIATAAGVFDLCQHLFWVREDFGNPYLIYSPWRPLITIALPLFWAALLMSPPMRRWNNRGNQSDQPSGRK